MKDLYRIRDAMKRKGVQIDTVRAHQDEHGNVEKAAMFVEQRQVYAYPPKFKDRVFDLEHPDETLKRHCRGNWKHTRQSDAENHWMYVPLAQPDVL